MVIFAAAADLCAIGVILTGLVGLMLLASLMVFGVADILIGFITLAAIVGLLFGAAYWFAGIL